MIWFVSFLLLILAPVVAAADAEVMVVFLFTALLIGAMVTFILSRYAPEIPYTVVVFAIGAILNMIFTGVSSDDVLKQSQNMWNNMEPELILYLFLPALLFGEAMSLNFHHVRGAIVPAAILAGPGALFGALFLGFIAKFCLPYNWSWSLSIIFGSILCATDPVAVVALLKSAGASNKLTYLIIGEALMNDGTALVLYNLLYTTIKAGAGPTFTALDVFIYFLRVIFISPLLGGAFGAASVMCLSFSNRRMKEEDTTVQMAVTICCAYLSFFVAEYVVGVSGVLCCCSAALTLARFAGPLILRPETMHSIWAAFEWIGNTLIFILAGLIISSRTFSYMTGIDVLLVFVIYIFVFIIRACTIYVCMPALRDVRLGKPTTNKEALFATWGGLRGAVSMALALSLVHSTENGETTISETDSHRVFFLVGGVAALTLMVNATSAGTVLEKLHLLDNTGTTDEHQTMLKYVKKRMHTKALQLLGGLRKLRKARIDPQKLVKYCTVLREHGCDEEQEQHDVDRFVHEWRISVAGVSPLGFGSSTVTGHAGVNEEDIHTPPSSPILARSRSVNNVPTSMQMSRKTMDSTGSGNTGGGRSRSNSHTVAREPFTTTTTEGETEEMKETEKSPTADVESSTKEMELISLVRQRATSRAEAVVKLDHALSTEISPFHLPRSQSLPNTTTIFDEETELPDTFHRNINERLLLFTRRAFLEVVRISYWKQINSGKLPRNSTTALILLSSVDVALENLDGTGLKDWDEIDDHFNNLYSNYTNLPGSSMHSGTITSSLNNNNNEDDNDLTTTNNTTANTTSQEGLYQDISRPAAMSIGSTDEDYYNNAAGISTFPDQPAPSAGGKVTDKIAKSMHDYRDGQAVYLLTAFVDAHINAQQRITLYLGDTETVDTPEEAMVVQESRGLVAKARKRLLGIEPGIMLRQVTKATARWVIHSQQDQIEEFMKEGIITPADAEELLHECEEDLRHLGKVEWTDMLSRATGALCRGAPSRFRSMMRVTKDTRTAIVNRAKRGSQYMKSQRNSTGNNGFKLPEQQENMV